MLLEPDLVYKCIKNIEDGSQIFFSISGINMFSKLLRRASDISKAIKRSSKRPKEVSVVLDMCAPKDKPRKRGYRAVPPPRNYESRLEVPPIPIPRV